ncbi:HTH_Tnp_Tc3_2 domain-containing protein [Trichonephila clavipes]|nr:HTH_Tnp_Tc3_2 domain-containing protein [Trichonephila clavipes]
MDNGGFQRHDGSGRPTVTANLEDSLIVISAVTAPDLSLSTIRRATHTRVSSKTIHRRLIEQNLRSHRPLRHLSLTPAHCRARLQWCLARSGWNHADWGRFVFIDESPSNCVQTIIEDESGDSQGCYLDPVFQQDNARPSTARVTMNCLTACQTLPWPARSSDFSPIEHVWNMMEKRLHLSGNFDDLAR